MTKKRELPADAAALRHKAEKRLIEKKKATAHLPTEADTQRLFHELQVHQIELEMQNEELQLSRAEMEEALKQYTELYDCAPVGYLSLGRDGTIRQTNLTSARLLDMERSGLIDRRLGLFVSTESRPDFDAFLKTVFDGRIRGTCELLLQRGDPNPTWVYMEAAFEDREVCRAVMMDVTARRRAEDELRFLSTHDALTGVYNRGYFEEEMARLQRGRRFPVSLVMADVDRLKDVNDRQGHAAGDAVLQGVAGVLTSAFRAEDVVARIGGDEFAVLLPDTNAPAAEAALRRARQALQEHNGAGCGTPIRLSFGVGTAVDPLPLWDVLKEADASMYREKGKAGTS